MKAKLKSKEITNEDGEEITHWSIVKGNDAIVIDINKIVEEFR